MLQTCQSLHQVGRNNLLILDLPVLLLHLVKQHRQIQALTERLAQLEKVLSS